LEKIKNKIFRTGNLPCFYPTGKPIKFVGFYLIILRFNMYRGAGGKQTAAQKSAVSVRCVKN